MADGTRGVSVRGGPAGIEARYEDLRAAARRFGEAALDLSGAALALHGYLAHPAVIACTALDPAGSARFDAALLAALDGRHGVTALAGRSAAVGAGLRAAATAYEAADRLEATDPLVGGVAHLPGATVAAAACLVRGQGMSATLQDLITSDPQLADLAAGHAAALLGTSVGNGAGLLGGLFDDGRACVEPVGDDPGLAPPRSLRDLVAGLAVCNAEPAGTVGVRILDPTAPGRRRVIVDIPGTKDWSLGRRNHDITSLATNLRALGGGHTSYEDGVLQALHMSGVRADDDVLIVGHSEGGMIAVNAARHLAETGEFHVGQVITLGAPVGATSAGLPRSVSLLAVENDGDVVPHLDDAENPDRANVTTVRVHRRTAEVGVNHDLRSSYLPGAGDIDASEDPSVRACLGGLAGFFNGAEVRTNRFRITRTYS